MKLAWIVYGPLAQPTGGYVYDRLVVDRLRRAGDTVEVVSIAEESDANDLAGRLLSTQADVIVADALCAREAGVAFEEIGRAIPRVLLVHHLASWEDNVAPRARLRADEARALAHSDHVVVTSAATARRLANEHGEAQVDVVEPGADRLPHAAAPTRDGAEVALLFVGSMIPRKRIPLLFEAMERLADARIVLRIVGDATRDPAHARTLAEIVRASPWLAPRVTRVGTVDDRSLASELARADALVLPSSLEGYGMVLTEALHAGLPVVAARASAIPDVVRDGGAALLFEDAVGLAGHLRRFAEDAALRDRLRRAASALGAGLPTWARAAASFRDLLSRTVEARGRGRGR